MLNNLEPNTTASTSGDKDDSRKRKGNESNVLETDQQTDEERNQMNPKKRKDHEPYLHDGHTYHMNSQSNDGSTIYYECGELVY